MNDINYAQEYLDRIKSGDEVVSQKVKAVYEREVGWMKYPPQDFPFYYDPERGNRHIEFIEKFCKLSQGDFAGKPIKLELFQKAKIQMVFGWVEKETHLRRFREVDDLRGRKCGKSTETAAVEWDVTVNDGEMGAQVYCTANKKDQAKIIFGECVNMLNHSPALKSIGRKRQSDIYVELFMSSIMPLAADSSTLDGLNTHFFSLDEFHEQKSTKLYDVMIQSQSSRSQPLAWLISTNGFVREAFFDERYSYCENVAVWNKGFEDYTLLPLIYELDKREEWEAPECWAKANPGLGKIKKLKRLSENVIKAKRDKTFLPTLLTKDFNLKENSASSWLTAEDAINTEIADMNYLRNSYAIGGCDLSSTTDLTCATLIIKKPGDAKLYVLQKYFIPESKIKLQETRSKQEGRYKEWSEDGFVSVSDGATVNFHDVTEWFVYMVREWNIRPLWIGYDAALSGYWREEMDNYGFEMDKIRQGPYTWTYPFKQLKGLFEEHRVVYQNNPVLLWCLFNTGVKSTNKDGIESQQPVKQSSVLRIDGTVSLLNAFTCMKNHEEEYMTYIK